jgi:predicted ATPase/class 3 adenylate cyclase
MPDTQRVVTFLFTDIEGSSALWESAPERMRPALARHDALVRGAVERHRGAVVKMLGDGVHAAFDDPADALDATLELQRAFAAPASAEVLSFRVRAGLHSGAVHQRDNDYYGSAVNRAARIMGSAHGGQILVSQAVADLVAARLPDGVRLHDLGNVRLRDLTRPERLFQVQHPDLRRDFPALRSLEATPNNLPQQVSSFVGRERELAAIKQLLGTTRLLTLLGPGGIGKTRLSLHAGADAMDAFPDGAWFIDLAALADPLVVPQALAATLGVSDDGGRPVAEAVAAHLRDHAALVILDNCEHLLQATAELAAQLLRACPKLRVLATSREALHVAGEAIFPVPELAFPPPGHTVTLDTLAGYAAARLFVQRVGAAQPSLKFSDSHAAATADICRRLEGIPLAIELAAARVRTLPIEKVAERLGDRFRLLTGGDQAALPRQQTLRALIDWSYDLLTEPERALLGRLAVFAGGWTLEAAEAVGAGGALQEADVMDLLANLVDKSLVVLDAQGERYRMLETVREYAVARLGESGDGDAARARHLAFHLALAEAVRPQLEGAGQAQALARIDLESENLLAAHAWCDHDPDGAALGQRLVRAVHPYWFMRGLLGLGLRVNLAALARPGTEARTPARSRGLFDAGQLCGFLGRYGEAQALLEESLAIAREQGDGAGIAMVLQPLAMTTSGLGDHAAARRYVEEAVDLARALGDKRELVTAVVGLAQIHRIEGRPDLAGPLYEQAIALAREIGHDEALAIGLLNIAMVWVGCGAGPRAHGALAEAVSLALALGSKPVGQGALDVAAGLAASQDEHACAARWFGAAQAQMALTGLQRDPTDQAFVMPLVERSRLALGEAPFAAAERAGCALGYDEAVGEVGAWLARAGGVSRCEPKGP